MNDGAGESESVGQKKLIVWCDDAAAAAPLVAALRQRFAVEMQDSLPALWAWLDDLPAAGGLLLYLSPAETLCRAMAAQTLPSAALTAWQSRAEDILGLNRRDRRRIRLLDIGAARANPDMFRRHFELLQPEMSELPPQDQLLGLMADQIMSRDPHARRIQRELEAASLDCTGGKRATENPDAAFYAYQRMSRAQQKAEEERQKVQKDVDLLRLQNWAVQEELDTASRRKIKLESSLEAANQDRQKARRDVELLQAQTGVMKHEMDALSTDCERLEQRLAQMSRGMESYQAQLSALSAERDRLAKRGGEKERSLTAAGEVLREVEAQRDHLAAHLKEVQADREAALGYARERAVELQRILSSKSFRLTAPLRHLRSLLSGGGMA